ncbi:hypothetical protein AgCh_000706 [Apium graveolens]
MTKRMKNEENSRAPFIGTEEEGKNNSLGLSNFLGVPKTLQKDVKKEVEEGDEITNGENFVCSHVGVDDTMLKEDRNEDVEEHIKEGLANLYEDDNEGDVKHLVKFDVDSWELVLGRPYQLDLNWCQKNWDETVDFKNHNMDYVLYLFKDKEKERVRSADPPLVQPLTQDTPVLERIVTPRDARNLIELNQYKYTNVPVAEEHMANLTSNKLAEAIRLYREEQARDQIEYEHEDNQEESGDSQQSRRSIFDRIGAKGKKNQKEQSKKETEATRKKRLE